MPVTPIPDPPPIALQLEDWNLADAEEAVVRRAIEEAPHMLAAATWLGITRHALRRRMTKYGIEPKKGKTNEAE